MVFIPHTRSLGFNSFSTVPGSPVRGVSEGHGRCGGGGENTQKQLSQEKAVRGSFTLDLPQESQGHVRCEFVPKNTVEKKKRKKKKNTVEGAMGQSQPKSCPSCALADPCQLPVGQKRESMADVHLPAYP